MTAPTFYGIDPDILYPWTPSEAIGEDGKPVDGAPVVLLGALSERLSLRVGAARQKQAILYTMARKTATERLIKDAADLDESAKDSARDAIIAEEIDKLEEKASAIYTEDLQSVVLSESVKGWENIRSPSGEIAFSGDWSRDGRCLPATWKAAIFYALVTESAFNVEGRRSFTSPLDTATA